MNPAVRAKAHHPPQHRRPRQAAPSRLSDDRLIQRASIPLIRFSNEDFAAVFLLLANPCLSSFYTICPMLSPANRQTSPRITCSATLPKARFH